VPVVKRGLMRVKSVMHFPKLAFCPSCLCRVRRVFGVGMHFRERKVAKYKPKTIAQLASDFPPLGAWHWGWCLDHSW
jgi:hypothetical protein